MRRVFGLVTAAAVVACSAESPSAPEQFVSLASVLGASANNSDLAPPTVFNTQMRSELESPACVSDSKAHAHIAVQGDGSIKADVAINNQGGEVVRFGHIHYVNNLTTNTGPIIWWISPIGVNQQSTERTLRFRQLGQYNSGNGEFSTEAEALAEMLLNPDEFYVNVHSNSCPGGFARGFLN
jgi:hypothetical protein